MKTVLSYEDKVVIKNDKMYAHQIWKIHHQKKWDYYWCVNRLLNGYQISGSIDNVEGSSRPKNMITEEKSELVRTSFALKRTRRITIKHLRKFKVHMKLRDLQSVASKKTMDLINS